MAYIVMAYIAMAYIVMACIVMAYTVMADKDIRRTGPKPEFGDKKNVINDPSYTRNIHILVINHTRDICYRHVYKHVSMPMPDTFLCTHMPIHKSVHKSVHTEWVIATDRKKKAAAPNGFSRAFGA